MTDVSLMLSRALARGDVSAIRRLWIQINRIVLPWQSLGPDVWERRTLYSEGNPNRSTEHDCEEEPQATVCREGAAWRWQAIAGEWYEGDCPSGTMPSCREAKLSVERALRQRGFLLLQPTGGSR